MENNNCYLYRHIRLDTNQPFYIGIGTKRNRSYKSITTEYERAYRKDNRNSYWNRIVNKFGYVVQIVLDNLTLEEAKLKEIEFISMYGRRDLEDKLLCNRTNGGDSAAECSIERVTKKVLNFKTGKIYNSVRDLINEENLQIKIGTLRTYLSGSVKNNTDYVYLDYDKDEYLKRQNNIKKKGEYAYKELIDTKTGRIFKSITEAAIFFNIGTSYLSVMLRNVQANNTSLKFLKENKEAEENKKLLEFKKFNNKCKRKIIDIKTNEVFDSIRKAADSLSMKYTTLNMMLLGQNPNKTNFRYLDNN
jgi:hypothetical protein